MPYATTYWVQATLPIKKNHARSHELHIVITQVLPALHHAHLNTTDAWHSFYKFHFSENYFIFIITTASTAPYGWQKKVGFTIHYTYQENVY
jgi:hypothetical protein